LKRQPKIQVVGNLANKKLRWIAIIMKKAIKAEMLKLTKSIE